MKIKYLIVVSILFTTFLIAQSGWNMAWEMSENPFQPPQSGSGFTVVKAGFDTDNDGMGEFIASICDGDSNFVMMYEATADNTYELVWSWKYPDYSSNANSYNGITVGDTDNNGVDEILATLAPNVGTDDNPPRLYIFEWNGVEGENKYGNYSTGVCEPHGTWNYGLDNGVDYRPHSLIVEDIDGDGANELITGMRGAPSANNGQREIIVSSFVGKFTTLGSWIEEFRTQNEGGALYSVTTGDLDGDGNKEIYGLLWDLFTLRIYEATGPDTYELQSEIIQLYGDEGIDYGAWDGVAVADVDNDGTNEMYIAGMVETKIMNNYTIFTIQGKDDNSTIDGADVNVLLELPQEIGGGFNNLEICDPDGDGNMNLMIAGRHSGKVFDIEYKGAGNPADPTSWDVKTAVDLFELAAFDLGITVEAARDSISPRIAYGSYAVDMDGDKKDEYVFVNYSTDFPATADNSGWENDAYVWIIEDDGVLAIKAGENSNVTNFTLAQNYPNPFNPQTNITYSLKKSDNVKFIIYDMLGKKIRTLVNEYKHAGEHSIVWDGFTDNGQSAASGLYLYKIFTSGSQQSKTMSLVR